MPRRTSASERPSRHADRTPAATPLPIPRSPMARSLMARLSKGRRWSAAVAALAPAALAPAVLAPTAALADDGVVALSGGPGFADAAPAWVQSADGAGSSHGAGPVGGSVLPAGYVSPSAPAQFGPHAGAVRGGMSRGGMTQGGMSRGGRSAAPGGLYDPAVAPAQYAPPAPAPYCPPGGFVGPGGGGPAGPVDYRVRGGRPRGPGSLWTTIARMKPPTGSFARLEYLRYSMVGEEAGPVGAPVQNVTTRDVVGPFGNFFPFGQDVFDDRNDGNFTQQFAGPDGAAVVAGLNNNDIDEFDGARITIGRGIKNVGRVEAYLFAFSQETFTLQPTLPLFGNTLFPTDVSVPTTTFGTNAGLSTAFDTSYELEYETEFWGAGARMYFDQVSKPIGFGIRPLVGVRYMMLNQNMYQRGTTTVTPNGPSALYNRELSTTVHNNLFGTELGLEAELRHEYFTLGVRPSVSAGLNQAQVRTRSFNFAGPNEGVTRFTDHHTQLSPVLDLAAYLRVPMGENFKLSVGYDLIYIAQVARPNESTSYDLVSDSNGAARSNVRPRRAFDDITFNGLTIGVEMLLPEQKRRRTPRSRPSGTERTSTSVAFQHNTPRPKGAAACSRR